MSRPPRSTANGPQQCSGLDVARYDALLICAELGAEFQLVEHVDETNATPWATQQHFSYFRFMRKSSHQQ